MFSFGRPIFSLCSLFLQYVCCRSIVDIALLALEGGT